MAEPTFDRVRFGACLTTRRLGSTLIARADAPSTNDVAWDALAAGTPDGTVVVADVQSAGRGRAGRAWVTAPGKGLAMSVALHPGCERQQLALLPLVGGLALARGLERLDAHTDLKWPNDLLLGGRKVSGVLVESRSGAAPGSVERVVIGVGVNVSQTAADFPPELAGIATSLAMEGIAVSREEVAAAFLNALEPLWTLLQEGGREETLAAWKQRAAFWGRTLRVVTPSGVREGIARDLDPSGALVLEQPDGARVTIVAGDVESPAAAERAR